MRDHRPGEVWYNLHEYPKLPLRQPSQEDWDRFASYAADGIEIVKFHMEWADWAGICGGGPSRAADPAGLDVLLDMAHQHGLKVLLYFSSGFHDVRSADHQPSWSVTRLRLQEYFYDLALCSPRNPDWRAHVLQTTRDIMDRHDADGLYNDCGFFDAYDVALRHTRIDDSGDVTGAFRESEADQEAFSDLLHLVRDQMTTQRPGAIMGLHCGRTRRPPVSGRPYDRLYIGEAVGSLDELLGATKAHEPYTYVIPDERFAVANPRAVYAATLPHLQFPVAFGGAPVTGERVTSDRVQYADPDRDYWTKVMTRIAHHRAQGDHPTYGWWDSVPGNPQAQEVHRHLLGLWRGITVNGTRAFLDARSDLVAAPAGVIVSYFVNERIHAVVANLGNTAAEVRISPGHRDLEDSAPTAGTLAVPAGDLKLLELGPALDDTRSAWDRPREAGHVTMEV